MSEQWPSEKRLYGSVVAWTLGLVALAGALSVALWAFGVFTAPAKGRGDARKQIQSASFRIAAYDHFFNLCGGVQGLEGQLDAQYEELTTATGDDIARVRANIAGIKGERSQAVAEYNQDARKDYTIGQFKSSALPYALPVTYTKGDDHTSCGS